ncbi:hypothetical protein D3C71_1490470 [compost metagenome]
MVVTMLCIGMQLSHTFHTTGMPMDDVDTSMCGTGGTGVLQTSGNPNPTLGNWQSTCMVSTPVAMGQRPARPADHSSASSKGASLSMMP